MSEQKKEKKPAQPKQEKPKQEKGGDKQAKQPEVKKDIKVLQNQPEFISHRIKVLEEYLKTHSSLPESNKKKNNHLFWFFLLWLCWFLLFLLFTHLNFTFHSLLQRCTSCQISRIFLQKILGKKSCRRLICG